MVAEAVSTQSTLGMTWSTIQKTTVRVILMSQRNALPKEDIAAHDNKTTNLPSYFMYSHLIPVHDSRGSVLLDHEQDVRRRQQYDGDEGSEEEVFGLDDGEDEDEDDMSDLGDVGGEQEDSEEDIDSKSSLTMLDSSDRQRSLHTNKSVHMYTNRGILGKEQAQLL